MNFNKKTKNTFSKKIILSLTLALGLACSDSSTVPVKAAIPYDKTFNIPLEGKASWIGERFQGKKTASGELFDMNDLTASHATLPFGTVVKVISLKTKKSVTVRINNRSEIDSGRVIDLSKRAAEQIGLIEEGVGTVRLEIASLGASKNKGAVSKTSEISTLKTNEVSVKPASENISSKYQIQFGSFFDLDNAVEFRDALKKKNIDSTIDTVQSATRTVFRVNSTQKYLSRNEAKAVLEQYTPQEGTVVPVPTSVAQMPSSEKNTVKTNATNSAKPESAQDPKKASAKTISTKASAYEYGIQFGAFETADYAKDMQNKLLVDKGIRTIIHQFPDDDKKLFRVLTNHSFVSREESSKFLKESGVEGTILTFTK